MCYTIHDLEPFTYYRTSDYKRGFLLANIVPDEGWRYVVLLEFGKSRNEGVRHNLDEFLQLITDKKLIKFIPKTQ